MRKSIIVYETYYGTSKRTAEIFSLILGSSRVKDVNENIDSIKEYNNIIFIFSFHGKETGEKTKIYLEKHKEEFKGKRIGIVGVGLTIKDLDNYIDKINKNSQLKFDYKGFVSGELRTKILTEQDKNMLEKFLDKVNMPFMDMGKFKINEACLEAERCAKVINEVEKVVEENVLIEDIKSFILRHNTCALATGNDKYIRCTPIEYAYYNDKFYLITEGGFKFIGIIQNDNVCIAIFNKYIDMNSVKGLQVTGKASIVPINSYEYEEVMKLKGIQLSVLQSLPINMNLIRIDVEKYEYLNSNFKKNGYDIKQTKNL